MAETSCRGDSSTSIRHLEHKIYVASLILDAWNSSRLVVPPEYIEAKKLEMDDCAWGILAALTEL